MHISCVHSGNTNANSLFYYWLRDIFGRNGIHRGCFRLFAFCFLIDFAWIIHILGSGAVAYSVRAWFCFWIFALPGQFPYGLFITRNILLALFLLFFSSGFHSRIRTSTHILTWGLCALPCDPCIEFICEPIYFVFWFLHSTQLRHICTIAGDSILGFVWLLFSFSLNNLHEIVVPFGPGCTLYNFVLGDFRFGPNRTLCNRMNFPSSHCCRAHWNYWNFWKLSLRWAASNMLSISEIVAS